MKKLIRMLTARIVSTNNNLAIKRIEPDEDIENILRNQALIMEVLQKLLKKTN